jgi:hypothetical protein
VGETTPVKQTHFIIVARGQNHACETNSFYYRRAWAKPRLRNLVKNYKYYSIKTFLWSSYSILFVFITKSRTRE